MSRNSGSLGPRMQKAWDIYHRLERKRKERSLRRLSEARAIKILTEFYSFVSALGARPHLNRLDTTRLRTLANVHSMFGRVK